MGTEPKTRSSRWTPRRPTLSNLQSCIFRILRNLALIGGLMQALRGGHRRGSREPASCEPTARQQQLHALLVTKPWRLFVSMSGFRAALRLSPLLAIVAAYVLGRTWAPAQAGNNYFSAAAQVIPVLLLALAVESRILRFTSLFDVRPAPFLPPVYHEFVESFPADGRHRLLRGILRFDTAMGWVAGVFNALTALLVGVSVLVFLSLAEWECLSSLASPGAERRDPAVVSGGVLAGLVGVALIALMDRRDAEEVQPSAQT